MGGCACICMYNYLHFGDLLASAGKCALDVENFALALAYYFLAA